MYKHHKSWYIRYDPSAFIHKGPGRPDVPRTIARAINVRTLEERAEELVSSGLAERKEDRIHLDLSRIGFDKLLGGGVARNAWVLIAKSSSRTASRKISEAGGEVRVEATEKVEPKETSKDSQE